MLSAKKRNILVIPSGGIAPETIRDGKPGLADFVRCVAACAAIRMTAMRQWDRNLTRKGRINEAIAAATKIPPLLDS